MLCLWDTSGKPPHELQKDEVAQTCKKHQSEHWKFPQQMRTLKNKLTHWFQNEYNPLGSKNVYFWTLYVLVNYNKTN